jgi:Glycosyltransferase family 87
MAFSLKKYQYVFALFIIAFVTLFVLVEQNNSKFFTNDLVVYIEASRDYFNGNNPYLKNYGLDTGFFKYPPTTLYFFWIYTKLSFFAAQIIHTIILSISLIISVLLLNNIFNNKIEKLTKQKIGMLYLSFFFIAICVVRELHMGNVNLILLFLFSTGLFYLKANKNFHVALFWSFMVILKPIILFTFISLTFYKKWNVILYMVLFGLLFFILPLLSTSWTDTITLWHNWFIAVAKHGTYLVSKNSLTYLSSFYLGISSTWVPSLLALSLLMIVFLFQKLYRSHDKLMIYWTVIFFIFAPNFFVTDTEHFLLTLPILLLLVAQLSQHKKIVLWVLFVIFIIPFSLNSNDLLGKNLSSIVDNYGLVGISNIGFIMLLIYLVNKNGKRSMLA